ncbi:PREDICTED: kelch domain-containing protein 10-like [Cyprinodon variegatus]|uniref:kelch domain-containing protein 10-like n=1 Tax=Cyprinodon variegatus TaxID=28743 RepID=UPI0007428393|nr:PREDICTED: kelch domain-containing protein 10-like [Cyprinodon variegatus]
MSSPEAGGTFTHLNRFEKLSWRPSIRDSGSKKRARWLQARRIFSPNGPNLRIPNRFLREGHCIPPARSGHRCVADSSNLYVFGGYNPDFEEAGGSENEDYPLFRELWRFHFATATWQQVRTEGYMPTELASMSAVFHGNNLLVFGGTGIPFGENNSNDVHVCNVQYRRWNLLNCKGKKPNKVYGQAMVIINGYLYVFGGTTGYLYSTDLHRLDLSTREWTHLKPKNAPLDLPEERYRHELAHDGQKIYILGGGTSWMSYPLDKIHAYNLETNYWEEIVTKPHEKIGPKFPHPILTYRGLIYSLLLLQAGCMYVHGGVVNMSGNRRTASLYKVWLVVPSLLEMTWEKLLKTFPHVTQLSTLQLLSLGLTHSLIQRLK